MRPHFLIVSLALVTGLHAAPRNHYPDPYFLDTQSLGRVALLPRMPLRHSATDREDYARILAYQVSRTADEVKRAAAVVDVKLATLFGPPWGPLTPSEVDRWSPFFTKVQFDCDYWVQETKKLNGRLRPYLANKRVQPAVFREWTRAYPSGHAAISRMFAALLSKLDPSREAAFKERAERIAEDRVLAGLHHPTDIAAGKVLADRVLNALWQTPRFRVEFARLQHEAARQREAAKKSAIARR